MRDFFIKCLNELEAITGLRQLAFWEMEAAKDIQAGKSEKEARNKFDVCVAGMVEASKKFPEIEEERQRKHVRRMMVEDTTYEALNSRTIYRWLNQYRQQQAPKAQLTEEDLSQVAPPEVADKYIKEFQESLAKVGTGMPTVTEIEQGLKEVKRKETGRQRFEIEGIEIWAMNHKEAQKAFDATFNHERKRIS